MNIKTILEIANKEFEERGIDNYFFETRELLAISLGKNKEWIMSHIYDEVSENDYKKFLEIKNKRIEGTPFQYILGEQFFMGLKFLVNSDVLIPRADTEILVYKVLDLLKNKERIKILDMCTGSGCIAISLAKNLKCADITAVDISENALKVAKKNSEINETNVKFLCSDLFNNLSKEKFNIIVSNPPYITTKEMETLNIDVLKEPHLALEAGEDGLKFYRKISCDALDFLEKDGVIAFEIGYNQAESVSNILRELGYKDIECIKDYSNNDRVVIARK